MQVTKSRLPTTCLTTMASNDDTSNTKKGGKPKSSSSAAEPPPYDPRQFQNPHPEDSVDGEAEGKGKGKGKATTKTKASKSDTSGKAAADGSHCCYHCGTAGALSSCADCHCAWYCGRACQKAAWRQHKAACRAAKRAKAKRAAWRAAAAAAGRESSGKSGRGGGGGGGGSASDEMCVICIGPVVAPVRLPCNHAYCSACLAELRAKEVAQTCPLCRAKLPEGLDGLWELAYRAYCRIQGMVSRGEASWMSLPAAEREEMEEVVAMLTEAAAQGHMMAQVYLAEIYAFGKAMAQDDGRAFELYGQAALQGNAISQLNLGVKYREGLLVLVCSCFVACPPAARAPVRQPVRPPAGQPARPPAS